MRASRRRGIVAGLVAISSLVAGCSGAGDGGAGEGLAAAGDPLQAVHDSVAALRDRPMSSVSIVGSLEPSPSGTGGEAHLGGRYSGADGGSAFLSVDIPGATRSLERYLVGGLVIQSTTMPGVPRAWTSFDPAVLDAAVAPDVRVFATGNQAMATFVTSREPSPLVALDVLARSTGAIEVEPEVSDGRRLRHLVAQTPAAAVIGALGPAAAAHASVDCRDGVGTDVWIDDAGELVRLRYRFDHLALVADVSMAFAPDESGSLIEAPDGDDVFDLTADLGAPPPQRRGVDSSSAAPDPPCSAGSAPPVVLDRTCPDDDPGTTSGWGALGRRADGDPLGRGWAWFSFAEPVPPADAVARGGSARVTGLVASYSDASGGVVTATSSSIDASSAEAVVHAVRARDPSASDVRVAAILVEGPWGDLARAGSGCTTVAAELAPWSPPQLFGVP